MERRIRFGWVALLALVAAFASLRCVAADSKDIPIWNGTAPGSEGLAITEKEVERSKDPALKDRAYVSIVSPALIPFIPANPNGAAVLIMPGGAYERVVADKEGADLAEIFNKQGVAAFVLKYRLPAEGHANRQWVPLQDAQRALRVIRFRAKDWGLDPARIGVMGFSAGGHLAATLGVGYDRKVYDAKDDIDQTSARPDFMALIYPVISMDPDITHAGSAKNLMGETITGGMRQEMSADGNVTDKTPPAFIVCADDDDAVPAENSLKMYAALRKNHVPSELVIFAKGGHGFGIRNAKGLPAAIWPQLFLDWLGSLKK